LRAFITEVWTMRVDSIGQVFFALVMVGLGVLGLVSGDFASVWQPVPKEIPGREILAYASAAVSLAGGMGLLWESTAAAGAQLLTVYLLLWLLVLRIPAVFVAPLREVSWSGCGENAIILAGSLILVGRFANRPGRQNPCLALAEYGSRSAGLLFGLALIPCGLAHLVYSKDTAALVPNWLPWHLGWAYSTGGAYLLAGVSIVVKRQAALAATLTAAMMAVFTATIWIPTVAGSPRDRFGWTALLISLAITAGAWLVAESFRRTPASHTNGAESQSGLPTSPAEY
jgi:uncharacterized membrane protein